MNIIEAEGVSYVYPVLSDDDPENPGAAQVKKDAEKALDGVSLSVRPGQFICILGRNGSGKSTFARQLNAILAPTEGTLWVDGMDSKDESKIMEIRRKVGMVFQNPDNQIIGSIVDEEVAFGLENLGATVTEIRKGVYEALDDVGMREYAKASPNRLSGGQKQRIAVAGVLAMQPKCIVLDESTAMLDPKGRREVMDTVKKLNKEQGITILSITHYMEEALDADYVFVMEKGRLKMQGTPKEIFSREEEIEQLGLKLPQLCELAKALREAGMNIPKETITEEELFAAITACSRKEA